MKFVTEFALATRSREPKEWGNFSYAGRTVRLTVTTKLHGSSCRLRLANRYGGEPVRFRAAIAAGGRSVPFEFDCNAIPAGGEAVSGLCPVELRPGEDVYIYIYCADEPEDRSGVFEGEWCEGCRLDGGFQWSGKCQIPLFASLEVTAEDGVCVAAYGDSITQMRLWTDEAARRCGKSVSFVNLGIGGNRLLRDTTFFGGKAGQVFGKSGLERFDWDLKPLHGVKRVLVALGINDISQPDEQDFTPPLGERAGADQLIAGFSALKAKIEGMGAECVFCTVTPFGGMLSYCDETETTRRKLNDWFRTQRHVDFAAAVEDPAKPGFLRAEFDSGDHLHPSPAGGLAMAAAIPDELLR